MSETPFQENQRLRARLNAIGNAAFSTLRDEDKVVQPSPVSASAGAPPDSTRRANEAPDAPAAGDQRDERPLWAEAILLLNAQDGITNAWRKQEIPKLVAKVKERDATIARLTKERDFFKAAANANAEWVAANVPSLKADIARLEAANVELTALARDRRAALVEAADALDSVASSLYDASVAWKARPFRSARRLPMQDDVTAACTARDKARAAATQEGV